jgi:glutamate synthase (NADPH/NADH) small chain
MFRDGYKSIFIGTGVWKPNSLKIKGETLGNVHYAINYLSNPDVCGLGEELVIIGAGNSAIDVARTALRKGVKKATIYSRSASATANKTDVEYAKIDGVKFEYNKYPLEILEDGVIFKDAVTGEEQSIRATSVIIAISQGPRDIIVSTTTGIDTTDKGLVIVNDNGVTTRAGVFASGDVVLGAKTVVEAVNYSKLVAKEMDDYMNQLDKD